MKKALKNYEKGFKQLLKVFNQPKATSSNTYQAIFSYSFSND